MTVKISEEFHAKIMLFGEYSIICNSMGLTIPYHEYKGKLTYISENPDNIDFAIRSNTHLKNYSRYVRNLVESGKNRCEFDIDRFESDIEEGIYFESNIPQGFGIGSSGALVAALYDHYAIDKISRDAKISNEDRARLKDCLGQLESYFHGKSSGNQPNKVS